MFLVLKEFEPFFSQGGDMAQDFLIPATKVKELETSAESSMKASLAKGMPHGYEVGYRYFTINGRMLGYGEPLRVKQGERVLFHVLNGSATEIRSLALPDIASRSLPRRQSGADSNGSARALVGTAERISALSNESSGCVDLGDLAETIGLTDGHRRRIRRTQSKARLDSAETISLELCPVRQTNGISADPTRSLI